MALHFVEQNYGEIFVLSLKGKLTGSPETDKLHEKIKSLIGDNKNKIVLDLRHINWLASVGIGAIMRCMFTVRNSGGDLRLTGLTEKVKNLFEITKLVGVIHIHDSINTAVESFN